MDIVLTGFQLHNPKLVYEFTSQMSPYIKLLAHLPSQHMQTYAHINISTSQNLLAARYYVSQNLRLLTATIPIPNINLPLPTLQQITATPVNQARLGGA